MSTTSVRDGRTGTKGGLERVLAAGARLMKAARGYTAHLSFAIFERRPSYKSAQEPDQSLYEALATLQKGNTARDERRWPEAKRYYRTYLILRSEDFAIWVQCGHAEKESGDFLEALKCYEQARTLRANDADLHLHLGHLFKLMQRWDEAAEAYRRCLSLDPTIEDAVEGVATVIGRHSPANGEVALNRLGTVVAAEPTSKAEGGVCELESTRRYLEYKSELLLSPELLAGLIDNEFQSGNWETVAALQRFRLRRAPTCKKHWRELAHTFENLNRPHEAAHCARIAGSLGNPQNGG